jgi:hypothetical protein
MATTGNESVPQTTLKGSQLEHRCDPSRVDVFSLTHPVVVPLRETTHRLHAATPPASIVELRFGRPTAPKTKKGRRFRGALERMDRCPITGS